MSGLYGHSCRAENYAVILVELNGSCGRLKSASLNAPTRAAEDTGRRYSAPTGQQDGAGAQNAVGAGFGQAAI